MPTTSKNPALFQDCYGFPVIFLTPKFVKASETQRTVSLTQPYRGSLNSKKFKEGYIGENVYFKFLGFDVTPLKHSIDDYIKLSQLHTSLFASNPTDGSQEIFQLAATPAECDPAYGPSESQIYWMKQFNQSVPCHSRTDAMSCYMTFDQVRAGKFLVEATKKNSPMFLIGKQVCFPSSPEAYQVLLHRLESQLPLMLDEGSELDLAHKNLERSYGTKVFKYEFLQAVRLKVARVLESRVQSRVQPGSRSQGNGLTDLLSAELSVNFMTQFLKDTRAHLVEYKSRIARFKQAALVKAIQIHKAMLSRPHGITFENQPEQLDDGKLIAIIQRLVADVCTDKASFDRVLEAVKRVPAECKDTGVIITYSPLRRPRAGHTPVESVPGGGAAAGSGGGSDHSLDAESSSSSIDVQSVVTSLLKDAPVLDFQASSYQFKLKTMSYQRSYAQHVEAASLAAAQAAPKGVGRFFRCFAPR